MSVQWFEFKIARATLDDSRRSGPRLLRQHLVAPSPRRGSRRQRCGEALERTEMVKGHGLFAAVAD